MMFRKALCLLLSIVLVFSLAACGETGVNSTISGDNNSSDDVNSDETCDDEDCDHEDCYESEDDEWSDEDDSNDESDDQDDNDDANNDNESDNSSSDDVNSDDESSDDEGSDDESSDDEGSDDEGSDDEGSDDEGSDDEGSDDEGSDDESSDDEGSDDESSDEEGSDDEGSDEEGSDEEGSDEEGSDEEGSDEEGSDEEGSDEEGSDEEGSDEEGSDEEGSDDEDTSDNESSDDSSSDNKTHRPHSNASNTSTNTKFVDTDGDFEYATVDWEKIDGYVIVYPADNKAAKKSAEALKDYFKSSAKVDLAVVADSTREVAKEILIGKTNRSESNISLKEGEIEVLVSGKKLVITGGHDVSVDSAVHKYIRTAPATGKASTFKITTDFSTTLPFLKDYYYVWGDEFEAEELDMTKWGFRDTMVGTPRSQNSIDRDVIDTGDGRLKLRAIRYFNPEREGTQYKMPQGTTTIDHMSFSYGYAEIRARMPFFRGIWPSFWTKSGDEVSKLYGVYRSEHYYIETDVLEVAGNEYGQGGSNVHRWFSESYGTCSKCSEYKYHTSGFGRDNPGTNVVGFTVTPLETRNQTYHTYGWEWTPTKMEMYFDGKSLGAWDISKSTDHCKDLSGFADPQYIIFNLQLTTTDSSNPVGFIEDSLDDLPAEYFLDYFRIYQKKDGKSKLWLNEEYIDYDRK